VCANATHTGTATRPLEFAGQYLDAESGLYYMRAREYDPQTGQFLTRDPLEMETGDPYGYAGGDPLENTDPAGLNWLDSGLNDLGVSDTSIQNFVDASAGIGDTLSFGLTKDARGWIGGSCVDTNSEAYKLGGYEGLALGAVDVGIEYAGARAARVGYVTAARRLPTLFAGRDAEAIAERDLLKQQALQRSGVVERQVVRAFNSLRGAADTAQYTAESAGRTNKYWNGFFLVPK